MNYHISVRKLGDKFVAGIDAEGAYQAFADTPLQAMRALDTLRWLASSQVSRPRNYEESDWHKG